MTASASAKKDVQRLQRAIVDGLEDVKGQDIVVFDTESLSPLFERVIIASGTSNRQTKALAASVRDAVREAGFDKPHIEGEDNGEWIIVDCGAAVAHVMQPVIRQYYRLEEIWGGKAVRLKHGAPKPAAEAKPAAKKPAAKKAARAAAEKPVAPVTAKKVVRQQAKAGVALALAETAKAPKRSAAKTAVKSTSKATAKAPAKSAKPMASKTVAKTPVKVSEKAAPAKAPVKTAAKPPIKTVVVKAKAAPKASPSLAAKTAAKPSVKPAAKKLPGRKKA